LLGGLERQQGVKLQPQAENLSLPKEDEDSRTGNEVVRTPQREIDPVSDAWDNTISVCAIMKSENVTDIREWLLYHKYVL
jgi:hypothetical protein